MCKCDEPDCYLMDSRAIAFLNEMGYDDMMYTDNICWYISIKGWDKIYQKWMDVFREWINEEKEEEGNYEF